MSGREQARNSTSSAFLFPVHLRFSIFIGGNNNLYFWIDVKWDGGESRGRRRS